jgi:hypothetical protein
MLMVRKGQKERERKSGEEEEKERNEKREKERDVREETDRPKWSWKGREETRHDRRQKEENGTVCLIPSFFFSSFFLVDILCVANLERNMFFERLPKILHAAHIAHRVRERDRGREREREEERKREKGEKGEREGV